MVVYDLKKLREKKLTQILYDTRNISGTTKVFAEQLADSLGLRAYHIDSVDYVQGGYILCTYTDGVGEVPRNTQRFLRKGENSTHLLGVVANGSSNFKATGLFAVAGDRLSNDYDVPLYRKIDMGGTNEDLYEVASRLNYVYNLLPELDKTKFLPESTYVEGKFTFKRRTITERPGSTITNQEIKEVGGRG